MCPAGPVLTQHVTVWPSLLTTLEGSFPFLCFQCLMPPPKWPDLVQRPDLHITSPEELLHLKPHPQASVSLSKETYNTVSILITSLVTLSYHCIELSFLHQTQFLENRNADYFLCLLCGQHNGFHEGGV